MANNSLFNLLAAMMTVGAGNTSDYVKTVQRVLGGEFNWVFPDTPLIATVNEEKVIMVGYKVTETKGSIETVDCMLCCDSLKVMSSDLITAFPNKKLNVDGAALSLIRLLPTGQFYTIQNDGSGVHFVRVE